jgi:2'-hydroxyisoflavone reductase
MTTNRRTFIRQSALAGGAFGLGALSPTALAAATGAIPARELEGVPGNASSDAQPVTGRYRGLPDVPAAERSLSILILGGTGFTGPAQVAYAVARGHRVTVFNRGRSDGELPAGVEQLTGDRNEGEVDALRGRSWDVVIDNPTTLPFWVRDAAEVMHDSTGQYVFISTISTYRTQGLTEIHEDSPLIEYDGDPLAVTPQSYTGALYGAMKVASEREAQRWFGDRTTIIRPGLIVGPRDQTDRFTWWPVRIARGGDIVAPGDGLDAVQIIDGRDLAEWTVRMLEEGTTGVFNATGPRARLTMAEQLHGVRAALPGDLELRFHWLPAEFLQAQQIRPWSEMTTWFGPRSTMSETRIERAVAAGLTFRPLATTAADTLEWFRSLPDERQAQMRAGLAPEKEREALAAWRASGRG